jgi:hypothetical protein
MSFGRLCKRTDSDQHLVKLCRCSRRRPLPHKIRRRRRNSGPDAARVVEGPLLQRTHALRLRGDKSQFLAIAAEHHQGWHAAAAPKAQPQGLRARPNFELLLEVVGLLVWHLQRVQASGACLR